MSKRLWTVPLTVNVVVYAGDESTARAEALAARMEPHDKLKNERIVAFYVGKPSPLATDESLPGGWREESVPFGADAGYSIRQIRAAEAAARDAHVEKEAMRETWCIGLIAQHAGRSFSFVYTNWRNETAPRRATFDLTTLRFARAEYHPEPAWLIDGVCLDKNAVRTFDLARMSGLLVENEPAAGVVK